MEKIKEFDERIDVCKKNKVVLWGAGFFGKIFLSKFLLHDIDVIAVCDSNERLHGMKIDNTPIISPYELKNMIDNDENIVVQSTVFTEDNEELEKTLISKFEKLGMKKYFMFCENELNAIFSYMRTNNIVDVQRKFVGSDEKNKIRITKIDDKLSIYKKNKVILWGNEKPTIDFLELFKYYNIAIYGFYCEDKEICNDDNLTINLISLQEIKLIVKSNKNYVFQISSELRENEIIKQLKDLNVKSFIVYNEAYQNLRYIKKYNYAENSISSNSVVEINSPVNFVEKTKSNNFLIEKKRNVVICSLSKTGDITLNTTFNKYKIEYLNMWHSPSKFNKYIFGENTKIKVITGVRDLLSQGLSLVYQWFGNMILGEQDISWCIDPFQKDILFSNNGDVQCFYDRFLELRKHELQIAVSGNWFIDDFNKYIINIMDTPFDKERGYSIIKEGNIEVFVYQLEKMNDCVKELAEFVDGDFTKWEMGNVAADKWVADSYKQAQKEIKISQEYFDKCFDSPYLNHFYSDEDIEKFKARWRPHIRK